MEFTNEEIIKYLVVPLRNNPNILIRMMDWDDNELFEETTEQIRYITFDGELGDSNLYVRLGTFYISLYCSDEDTIARRANPMGIHATFNEHFMFIDEDNPPCSCETWGEIVYGEPLRGKSHQEILTLLVEFIKLLVGITEMNVEWDELGNYTIRMKNDLQENQYVQLGNICFIVHENEKKVSG